MRYIDGAVRGGRIVLSDTVIGAATAHDHLALRLTLDADWIGLELTAQFCDAHGGACYALVEREDDGTLLLPVPLGATRYAGAARLTLRGVAVDDEVETIAVATAECELTVLPSGWDSEAEEIAQPDATVAAQLQAAIAAKQDAEVGKGLSTNDFTDEDKAKLHSHAAGAIDITAAQFAAKQDALTAGANITISGNVISAAGGGAPAAYVKSIAVSGGKLIATLNDDTTVEVTAAMLGALTSDDYNKANGVARLDANGYLQGSLVRQDAAPTANSQNHVTSGGVYTALAAKQDALTAGANITISGNVISASGGGTTEGNYELIEKIIAGYAVTTSEPSDWATAWTNYYTNTGTATKPTYTALTDATAPTWEAGTFYKKSSSVSQIVRSAETDATPYDFRKVIVRATMPSAAQGYYGVKFQGVDLANAPAAAVRVGNGYDTQQKRSFASCELKNGYLFAECGAMRSAGATNSLKYPMLLDTMFTVTQTVHRVQIGTAADTQNIPADAVIEIWAVR